MSYHLYFSRETMKQFVIDHIKHNASTSELEAIVDMIMMRQPDLENCVCYATLESENDDTILEKFMCKQTVNKK